MNRDGLIRRIGYRAARLRTTVQEITPRMEPYSEIEEARELFGDDFFGCDAAARILGDDDLFGSTLHRDVRAAALRIPFSRDELQRAKHLGMALVFRVSQDKYGHGLTIRYLRESARSASIFGNQAGMSWYMNEAFVANELPRAGWSLVSKQVISRSLGQSWNGQLGTLKQWADENFVRSAIVERRTAVEAVYDTLLFWLHNRQLETYMACKWHDRQFATKMLHDWTATVSSGGWPVFVGCYDSRLWIDALPVCAQDPCVGVCPSVVGLRDRESGKLVT